MDKNINSGENPVNENLDAEISKVTTDYITSTFEAPPEKLFHYTNDDGLYGILSTGSIWLTEFKNLNDPSEVQHSFDAALEILNEAAAEENLAKLMLSHALRAIKNPGFYEKPDHFLTCFSNAPDDLDQWRSYADNGHGYILQFDTEMLRQAFKIDGNGSAHYAVSKVIYGTEKLTELCRLMLTTIVRSFAKAHPKNDADVESFVAGAVISYLSTTTAVSALFKHKAYENEKETRFLVSSHSTFSGIRYRRRPYRLVRYLEFDWKSKAPDALEKIIIGPGAETNIAQKFAHDCLREFHPRAKIEVGLSNIPFRSANSHR